MHLTSPQLEVTTSKNSTQLPTPDLEPFVQNHHYPLRRLQRMVGNQVVQRLLQPPIDQEKEGANMPSFHKAAQHGLSGNVSRLPFLETIQRSFAPHDITAIRAYSDKPAKNANEEMGSLAYTMGTSIAFKQPPDLYTAAHEAAHVVQQQAGLQIPGGIGQTNDVHEQHANTVAEAVVKGQSASSLLDQYIGNNAASSNLLQFQPDPRSERYEAAQQGLPQADVAQPAGAGMAHIGRCSLRSGIMQWSLVPRVGYVNARIEFVPNATIAAASRTISFIQTIASYQTTGGFAGIGTTTWATRTEVDASGGSDPFYGAQWDAVSGHWGDEPIATQARPGDYEGAGGPREGSRPFTTSTGSAILNDSPMLQMDEAKQFETVVVVVETGEVLGSLSWNIQRWGAPSLWGLLGPGSSTIVRRADCREGASSGFQGVVDDFYRDRWQMITLYGFAAGSADLPAAHAQLDSVVTRLNEDTNLRAVVGGAATQDEPNPSSLSRSRAETVRAYLVSQGIASTRIKIEAYGADWARTPTTEAGAAQANRRVQIRLYRPRT